MGRREVRKGREMKQKVIIYAIAALVIVIDVAIAIIELAAYIKIIFT